MVTTLIGIIGAFIILACFVANEFNKLDRHSVTYDVGNVVGSIFLIAYADLLGSWPFLILNIVWALVALRDLFINQSKRSKNSAKI
jgi:formate hydrogenlyase subunit 3/multisubunit Na+/H+ antiporter MnhD subunit